MATHALSIFYPHLGTIIEQTGKSWLDTTAILKDHGISKVDISLEDIKRDGVFQNLQEAGLQIESVYVFCGFHEDPENFIALDVIS